MAKTDYFWTDLDQAQQRLNNSVVLYDDQPVYIEEIRGGYEDNVPRAFINPCDDQSVRKSKMLNSPKFKKFRELPKLGWMNSVNPKVDAVYLSRRTSTTRVHGLNAENVIVQNFQKTPGVNAKLAGGVYTFRNFNFDKGFCDAHNNVFPSLEKILDKIPENAAIAYSRLFAVVRDNDGIRWLYRGPEKVGIFTGVDTLNLLSKHAYLREEIMEDKAFTLNTIREF